jgi:hypothetical protein|tara:strand:- start:680 stop:1228 length:549 start_codon:yes stop_codon:yes gene_type:complete
MSYDDDFEIDDGTEGGGYGKGNEFSHQQLVMRTMTKCIEAGSKEMVEGFFNEKADKFGNIIKTYVPDTRKVFIESVKLAIEIMRCDLDNEAEKDIDGTIEELNNYYDELCSKELKDFFDANPVIKKQRMDLRIFNMEGTLNKALPYYQEYIDFEVNSFRFILGVLTKVTDRKGFYAEESYGA